jgi:hypothetical protein
MIKKWVVRYSSIHTYKEFRTTLQNLASRQAFAHLPLGLTFLVVLKVSPSLVLLTSISGHTKEKVSNSCGINIKRAAAVS